MITFLEPSCCSYKNRFSSRPATQLWFCKLIWLSWDLCGLHPVSLFLGFSPHLGWKAQALVNAWEWLHERYIFWRAYNIKSVLLYPDIWFMAWQGIGILAWEFPLILGGLFLNTASGIADKEFKAILTPNAFIFDGFFFPLPGNFGELSLILGALKKKKKPVMCIDVNLSKFILLSAL